MDLDGVEYSMEKTRIRNKITAVVVTVVSGLYSYMYLQDSASVVLHHFGRSAESYFRLGFLFAALIMTVAGVGLYMEKKQAYYLSFLGSVLLACHLLFTIVNSLMYEILLLSPVIFVWWMALYGADLLAPLVLYHLSRPDVKELFDI